MFRVEIQTSHQDNLSHRMADMRQWLDHRRSEPVSFRNARVAGGTVFRVEFKMEAEAIAFASAFDGKLDRRVLTG